MNFGIVVKVLGSLLIIEAAGMSLSLLVSIYFRQHDWLPFLISILLTALTGLAMLFFTTTTKRAIRKRTRDTIEGSVRNSTGKKETIKTKEGLTIVTLGWILVSLFGSLPFIISGSIPSFVDAFFETVSGFTTTGATLIKDIEVLPYGILFWRSFTHWIGGMGILVFTVAVLPALGVGSFQIFKAESPGPIADRIVPRIRDTAKILYITYIFMTFVEVILLVIGGMSVYESFVHTFGTVGTGGFSTRNLSIGAFNSTYINIVIAVFMVLSSTNFSLYYMLYKGRWKEALKDQELRLFLGVIGVSVILIAINITGKFYTNIWKSLEHSFFQVSSIISTTGYATADFDQWPSFSKAILFMLMFIGGCAGSTGGGMTSARVLVMLKLIKREMQKVFHPRAVIPLKLVEKTLSTDIIHSISSFFVLYIVIFVVGTIALSLEGISLTSASSAVAATLGNVGPGFEVVGPVRNYSQFSIPGKLLMSALMLVGRLELFTVIALFNKRLWRDEI
ncbi:MAG TPA: TrkH family potassium uptake protein [Clostridiales bacterium]|nr:TrkH family potassium uptake protein [Clostridiales bacterium]